MIQKFRDYEPRPGDKYLFGALGVLVVICTCLLLFLEG